MPVLASRIDGNVGLLGADYDGYFPVGDAAALAALMRRFVADSGFAAAARAQCAAREPLFRPARERQRGARSGLRPAAGAGAGALRQSASASDSAMSLETSAECASRALRRCASPAFRTAAAAAARSRPACSREILRSSAGGSMPHGADGRHRDRRRRRGLPPQRRAGADRDHRLLHADRRRPVRLRPHRRDQRDQRRLRHGRQADHGAGAGRRCRSTSCTVEQIGAGHPRRRSRSAARPASRSPAATPSIRSSRSTAWS